jgi:Family of unknown function (DUF6152)
MRKSALLVSLTAFGLLGAATTHAHHAVQAQFDVTTHVIIVGTLKKVDWTNPHAWFHFDVKNPDGTTTVWSVETIGPNGLRRLGISDRRLFTIGEQYKIDVHPERAGKSLGFVNSFTFPDGRLIKVGFPEEPGGEPPR